MHLTALTGHGDPIAWVHRSGLFRGYLSTAMGRPIIAIAWILLLCASADMSSSSAARAIEIVGITVTPHQFSPNMQWRRPPNPELSARVEVFLKNETDQPQSIEPRFLLDGKSPEDLIRNGEWAWHDTSAADGITLPPGALHVMRWNGISGAWGVETSHTWSASIASPESNPAPSPQDFPIDLANPSSWIQSVTFHRREGELYPTRMLATVRNVSSRSLRFRSCRLWLPESNEPSDTLYPQPPRTQLNSYSEDNLIRSDDWGTIELEFDPLPLSASAIEIELENTVDGSTVRLWSSMKIRPASFDISGGWVAGLEKGKQPLTDERYWKTLARMHINTGQIEEVAGYTDSAEIYQRFPLKRFNRMADRSRFDQDSMLPQIHAVEFLGEPQYGGGRPVPPQEVFEQLVPYRNWRIPTSVTLSEERTWRYYAGLSDYPHFDAYRVIAPAADAWSKYDRWGGASIRWGAPLETIGDMTRSLREQSRPVTIAYWSQGAHDGWGGVLSPRRGSPTPDELRSQAWHGLGNGIASLYWFNLSVKSLVKFPDLIDPIARVGREIQLLRPMLEEGTSYRYKRAMAGTQPDWDQTSLVTRDAALLVVHDLEYSIDERTRTFRFAPRLGTLSWDLPNWLSDASICFRIDSDGTHDVVHEFQQGAVQIQDTVQVVGIYIVTNNPGVRAALDAHNQHLKQEEISLGFDPVHRADDAKALRSMVE